MAQISLRKHWVKINDWRGYEKYDNSVYGGNMLAGFGDPYAESRNKEEKENIQKVRDILKKNKIPSRFARAKTSNVFAGTFDIVVAKKDFKRAERLVKKVV